MYFRSHRTRSRSHSLLISVVCKPYQVSFNGVAIGIGLCAPYSPHIGLAMWCFHIVFVFMHFEVTALTWVLIFFRKSRSRMAQSPASMGAHRRAQRGHRRTGTAGHAAARAAARITEGNAARAPQDSPPGASARNNKGNAARAP